MLKKIFTLLLVVLNSFWIANTAFSQDCSNFIGQNPSSAIPVCGTKTFTQNGTASCTSPVAVIPSTSGCTTYNGDNSFWYKFHCYQTGTLGFIINGTIAAADYDWEVFDVTGRDPNEALTNPSLMVSLNLYGVSTSSPPFPNYPTGCTSTGVGNVHCEGETNPFNAMPTIVAGHDYLLMITNFRSSGSGYTVQFGGGTANITDPKAPHLEEARAICDGTSAMIKMNKKMRCNSLLANGSEFSITPHNANVIAAIGIGCSSNFDLDSVRLTFDAPLPPGNYIVKINMGGDLNTLLDNCDLMIPDGEQIPMVVFPLIPTPMDSLTKPGCAPDVLRLVFKKRMKCNSIAADGTDFVVTGTTPITVSGAAGVCDADGLSRFIDVKLSGPIQTKGTYTITLQTGSDGNTIIDECSQETPAGASLNFATKDTVNADFSFNIRYGCKSDSVDYIHDGRNEVNSWRWSFDNVRSSTLQNPTILYASFGLKQTRLVVTNGVCRDTSAWVPVMLTNTLKSIFEATEVVCPNDLASFVDKSIGNGLSWEWDFANGNTSILQHPPQQSYFPASVTRDVTTRLIVTNDLGCKDTSYQKIKVPNHCYIAVPNAFTPNGDGVNDELYPINAYKATNLIFRIYNRFGQLLFETRDWTRKWNGKFKGQGADPGTYVWMLQYTNTDTGKRIEQKGTTILIR